MSVRPSLSAALRGIEIEAIEPAGDKVMDLNTIDSGHAMTELSASATSACSCCCCF